MIKYILVILLLIHCNKMLSQTLTPTELLNKSIQYHDPNGNWNTFNGAFKIDMTMDNGSQRRSELIINFPKDYFYLKTIQDTITTEYSVFKNKNSIVFCGQKDMDSITLKKYKLNPERATLYKNYYTYLYGLPMKLKDKGTILNNVQLKKFHGKDYMVLQVTYDETVGKETWYFYFNPTSYALEVYQFFKDESKNDGEYILLSEEKLVNGIKMPKIRQWYYNKTNQYLATDTLK